MKYILLIGLFMLSFVAALPQYNEYDAGTTNEVIYQTAGGNISGDGSQYYMCYFDSQNTIAPTNLFWIDGLLNIPDVGIDNLLVTDDSSLFEGDIDVVGNVNALTYSGDGSGLDNVCKNNGVDCPENLTYGIDLIEADRIEVNKYILNGIAIEDWSYINKSYSTNYTNVAFLNNNQTFTETQTFNDGIALETFPRISTSGQNMSFSTGGVERMKINNFYNEPIINFSYTAGGLHANGQNLFRGLDGWTQSWADSVLTTYYQVGRQAGNTIFSSLFGSPFNRLGFVGYSIQFATAVGTTTRLIVPTHEYEFIWGNQTLLFWIDRDASGNKIAKSEGLLGSEQISLPACSSTLKGLQGRNTTSVYECNGTTWKEYKFVETIVNQTYYEYFADVWMHNDSGIEIEVGVAGVYLPFNNSLLDNQELNGFKFNKTSGYLQPLFSGRYALDYQGSGSGVANHIYHMAIAKNGIPLNRTESHRRMSSVNDVGSMSGFGNIKVNAGDNLTLVMRNQDGTGTATVYQAGFGARWIGNV